MANTFTHDGAELSPSATTPHEAQPGRSRAWVERAARSLHREGFCVLRREVVPAPLCERAAHLISERLSRLLDDVALATRGLSSAPGGGTVFYVGRESHVYLKDDEEREEGGTPAIIGAIRAGLVMQLQKAVGPPAIAAADAAILAAARAAWGEHPRIAILGHPTARRLPIFALAIRATETSKASAEGGEGGAGDLLLHHNYVVALLNDLFGIQARGGCMCAGPYSQRILGIDASLSDCLEAQLVKKEDNELLRPGYVRISLPYFADAAALRAAPMTPHLRWVLLDPASGVSSDPIYIPQAQPLYSSTTAVQHASTYDL